MRDHDLSRETNCRSNATRSILTKTVRSEHHAIREHPAQTTAQTHCFRLTSNFKPQTSLLPPLPISLPSDNDWLLKIIAIRGRFVLGLYRRQMKAISYLGRIEKLLGVPATTRNWNTIEKVVKILTS